MCKGKKMNDESWMNRFRDAQARIAPYIERTRCVQVPELGAITGGAAYLKLENEQVTGSFKARGAVHKLLQITEAARSGGVLAASSGNHGAAVAYAASRLGCPATVFVPNYASEVKKSAIQGYGATVHVEGDDCVDTEALARVAAAERDLPYVSPYNDEQVMIGQGSTAVEILEQVPSVEVVLVALGGGGLIGGMGRYLKAASPNVEVIAVSPEKSPAMHRCMEAGESIEVPCFKTLSDATAGGVEPGAITVDVCCEVVDRSILVSEEAIASGMRWLYTHHGMVVEGAAGMALAGFFELAEYLKGKQVVVVICGANIDEQTRREVLGK
jgi:threonine dehydratase